MPGWGGDEGRGARDRRVLIPGSSGGLGLLAGRRLMEREHRVVLHARDAPKAATIRAALPGVEAVVEAAVEGDPGTVAGKWAAAEAAHALGPFDALVHDAGVGERGADRLTACPWPLS